MGHEVTGSMSGMPSGRPKSARTPGLVLVFAPDLDVAPAVVLLLQGATILGRSPPPGGTALPLTSVSRVHARVQRSGDRCTVHDLGSRNGIYVRGAKVDSAVLSDGDDVRIGDAIFIFVEDEAPLFSGSRADGRGEAPFVHGAIACGPRTRRELDELLPIAASTIPVLVLGETGAGKELIAEAVHLASGRRGQLRAVNCAALPASLVESELFGHRKGAFTGADRDVLGIVRAADGGTLFLDEIGELPLDVQPKLLRLLESNEVSPIGAARTERVDARVVCATNADLDDLVATKRFRGDLLARIRGHVVNLTPLRERKEDLLRIVRSILTRCERPDAQVSVGFMMKLVRHDWPYNVRELVAILRRALVLAGPASVLDVQHLPAELRESTSASGKASPKAPDDAAPEAPRPPMPSADELREAVRESEGNIAAVARKFGRDRSLIHRWLRQHGIDAGAFRPRG